MIFSTIKDNIRVNLNDAGITFFSADDINDSVQDAYDDIAFQTHCIVKKTSLDFETRPYQAISTQISDYLTTLAIFNKNNNRWLLDCLTVRDFDKIRVDWELWTGTPLFWAAASFQLNVILPSYATVPSSQMDVYYAAQAPTVVDADSPLVAVDYQDLFEFYSTADLLEQNEEYVKASPYWELYMSKIPDYRDRVKRLAKRDLLLVG
jgi:hypothetical protein